MESLSQETKTFENDVHMSELFTSETLSDVKFVFSGSKGSKAEIPAHKLILAMSSDVFRKMFFGGLKKTGNITITNASPEAFTKFLQFFYLNKVKLSGDKIEEVMDLAHQYDVIQCMTACSQFLKETLSDDNCCWVYELVLMYDIKDVMALCEEKIRIDPRSIFDKPSFKKCNSVVLECILEFDLQCDELAIFNACMEWAKCECVRRNIDGSNAKNYKKVLGDSFQLIRFPSMTNEEFCSVLQNYTCFFDVHTLADIYLHITLKRPLEVATKFNANRRQNEFTVMRDYKNTIVHNHTIHTQEVMKFSTNQRILLKGIIINERIHSLIKSELVGNLQIHSYEFSDAELLLDQMVKLLAVNSNHYAFHKPIIIQPKYKYEIEILFDAKSEAGFFPVEVVHYREKVKFRKTIEFQFEQSTKTKYDCVQYGIISGLRFVPL